jgi:peroxiredoxin
LQAYQAILPELAGASATLVAVSPMLPDRSLTTAERNELAFPVLSDAGNALARSFGLVFRLTDEVQQIYRDFFKIPLPEHNGDDAWELPITATYVISRDRRVRWAFVDPDYTKRAEPDDILEAIRTLG